MQALTNAYFSIVSCVISSTVKSNYELCRIWGFHSGDYEEYRLLGCGAVYKICLPPLHPQSK
jgi:hypothetical protein